MATSNKCIVCTTNIISTARVIKCDGICGNNIHVDCAFLNKQITDEISGNDNVHFICDNCNKFSLKALNNKIDGLYQYLYQITESNKAINSMLHVIKSEHENQQKKRIENKHNDNDNPRPNMRTKNDNNEESKKREENEPNRKQANKPKVNTASGSNNNIVQIPRSNKSTPNVIRGNNDANRIAPTREQANTPKTKPTSTSNKNKEKEKEKKKKK